MCGTLRPLRDLVIPALGKLAAVGRGQNCLVGDTVLDMLRALPWEHPERCHLKVGLPRSRIGAHKVPPR